MPDRARLAPIVGAAQRLTLAAGAAMLPLVVDLNASDSYVLPKLLVARALAIVLMALFLLRVAIERRLLFRRSPLDLPIVLFVGSATVSTAVAINRNLALFGAYDRYEGLLTIVLYAAAFWLTVQTLESARQAQTVLSAMIAGAYVAAIIAIAASVLGSARGVGTGESAFSFEGVARASGTLGNPTLLASLLAMLLPVAIGRAITAASWRARGLWINVVVTMTIGVLLTFSRAGILALGIGGGFVVLTSVRRLTRRRLLVGSAGLAAIVIGAGLVAAHGGVPVGASIVNRIASIMAPATGSNATRFHVWIDSVHMIGSRPIAGFGPDTFGLAYPRFESGNWTPGFRVDKAHSDVLQVTVTQGLIGLAAYLAIIVTTLTMFWKGRRAAGMLSLFAGWTAYQVIAQVNFSWLPASIPFWIFLGAAAVMAGDDQAIEVKIRGIEMRMAAIIGAAAALVLLVPLVSRPLSAEATFSAGLRAELRGDPRSALALMQQARQLSPENSTYAVSTGNLLLMQGRFREAKAALNDAVALGTEDTSGQRSLAIVEQLRAGG